MSDEIESLRAEASQLRRAVLIRPTIGVAVGLLCERYRLPDFETAVGLLRNVSRRHNVRMHLLADAVLDGPRPPRSGPWLPARRPGAAPHLALTGPPASTDMADVLDALLHDALTAAGSGRGGFQLAAPRRPVLTLERAHGQPRELLDRFVRVEGPHTAAGIASLQRRPVTVHDVAAATFYRTTERVALVDAGIRAVYVAPLLTSTGLCVGALSVNGERPGEPTRAELARVDDIAAHAAEWLLWYRETAITDALNDLHTRARTLRG